MWRYSNGGIARRFVSTCSGRGWWDHVRAAPKDPIVSVTEAFHADSFPRKINLGVVSEVTSSLPSSLVFSLLGKCLVISNHHILSSTLLMFFFYVCFHLLLFSLYIRGLIGMMMASPLFLNVFVMRKQRLRDVNSSES